MRFPDPPPRLPSEPLLPMINVVFLMLVFVLIAGRIAPPDPFAVVPPEVAVGADLAGGDHTLYLSAAGVAGFGGVTGAAALDALAAAGAEGCDGALVLRADSGAEAAAVARVFSRVAALGFDEVRIVTVAR